MRVRTILSGVAIAIALIGCSTKSAPLDAEQPRASPVNQSSNTDKTNLLSATSTPGEENETGRPKPVQQEEKKVLTEPITLFEVDAREFLKKTSEIPSYFKGQISYVTQAQIKNFNEGYNVELASPLERTIKGISNLIPYDYLPDPTIDEQFANAQGGTHPDKIITITTTNGIVFTKNPYNKETETTSVDVQVPKWGMYSVTWRTGQGSGFEIIQKITFQPHAQQEMKGSITILDLDDSWFEKKTSQIPSYGQGSFTYYEQASVDSHNQGHSVPWSDPLVQGMMRIANLIPFDYLQDEAITQQLSDRKDVIMSSNGILFTPKYKKFPGTTGCGRSKSAQTRYLYGHPQ
ncbi:hypothetical protein [Paenibacillus sp. GCM10027626]|uniref:hypothetical protein n=1 Tax=Paenibacillus sp. GCM10027626 TaxID=3273411 RepID=UPI0036453490